MDRRTDISTERTAIEAAECGVEDEDAVGAVDGADVAEVLDEDAAGVSLTRYQKNRCEPQQCRSSHLFLFSKKVLSDGDDFSVRGGGQRMGSLTVRTVPLLSFCIAMAACPSAGAPARRRPDRS